MDLTLNPSAPLPPMPPPGATSSDEDQNAIWQYVSRLALESRQAAAEWVLSADQAEVIYLYGDYPAPPDDRTVINDIQNQVISTVDAQTKDRASSSIEPRETGEPADAYWSGDPEVGLSLGVPPECLGLDPATLATVPPQPLPPQLGDRFAAAIESGEPVPVLTMAPPIQDPAAARPVTPPSVMLEEDAVTTVNDETTAEFFQGVHDTLWELGGIDQALESMVLWNNVHGYLAWLYEFDADPNPGRPPLPRLRKMSIRQVYLDPMHEDVRDAQYIGADVALDMFEAEAMFPDLAEFIRVIAAIGQPRRPDVNTDYGQAANRYFQRPVITMRIFCLRNQVMPMSPEDAIAGGHVTQEDVPDATLSPLSAQEAPDGRGASDQTAEGNPGSDGGAEPAQSPAVDPGDERGEGGIPVGDPGAAAADPQDDRIAPPARTAYLHSLTGEEVTPGHPQWPTRRGIRQIVTIGGDAEGRVPEDRECPHWDFPFVPMRNIPAPGKPYGQAEPIRLIKVQRANSGVAHSMVQCGKQAASPLQILPASVAARYKREYGGAYAEPGTVLVIEDSVLQQWNGKIDFIIPPPPMPLALVQLQPILGQWIDRLSGYGDADRGILPSAGASGKTVELLQQGSGAMKSFKAKGLRYAVQRITRLILHNAVHHMTVAQLAMLCRKHKPHVIAAFQRRGRTTDFDVTVKVAADGAARQQKQQEARANREAGITSLETTHDALNIDHKTEKRRMDAEAQKQAQIQAAAQAEALAARAASAQTPAA